VLRVRTPHNANNKEIKDNEFTTYEMKGSNSNRFVRTRTEAGIAATAWNFKKLMEILKEEVKRFFQPIFQRQFFTEYAYYAAA
jgi:hypothetical protein